MAGRHPLEVDTLGSSPSSPARIGILKVTNMNLEEKLTERVEQLIAKAQRVASTRYNNSSAHFFAPDRVDAALFHEWKNNSQCFISSICGETSSYFKNFVEGVDTPNPSDVDLGTGILKALKEDLNLGFLTRVKDLVSAEIFTDFIDMAQHLLDNKYKDPAASLVGAILENDLRQLSQKSGILVKSDDGIGALNTKLADNKVYNRLTQKQIQAWKGVRDSADHGKFDEYKSEDVVKTPIF